MKNNKLKSSALGNLKANSKVESKDSRVYNASISGASINRNRKNMNHTEDDTVLAQQIWLSPWLQLPMEITSRSKVLNKIPSVSVIIGLTIHHLVEILSEKPQFKYIDLKGLFFDESNLDEPIIEEKIHTLTDASKLTGLPERLIRKGLLEGYFIGKKVNGKWQIDDAGIGFIRNYAHLFIDVEKYF